jgi:hypothetical protein
VDLILLEDVPRRTPQFLPLKTGPAGKGLIITMTINIGVNQILDLLKQYPKSPKANYGHDDNNYHSFYYY